MCINPRNPVRYRDVTDWDLSKTMPEIDDNEQFFRTYAKQIFEDSRPLPYSEYWMKELKKDHDIYIITDQYRGLEHHTLNWLQKHEIPYDGILFAHDKTIMNGDYIIDDKVANLYHPTAKGICIIQPYNIDKYKPQVSNLYEAKKIIDNDNT